MSPYERLKETIVAQEKLLRVSHFSNQDALDLGNFLVDYAKRQGLAMAISIRKPTGAVLFQHLMEGTNANNQNWIRRKFNSVLRWEHSSLFVWAHERVTGNSLEDHGLSKEEYACCGGGVPLFMKTGELVAVLAVSSLPHFEDHKFAMQGLGAWLKVEGIPEAEEI